MPIGLWGSFSPFFYRCHVYQIRAGGKNSCWNIPLEYVYASCSLLPLLHWWHIGLRATLLKFPETKLTGIWGFYCSLSGWGCITLVLMGTTKARVDLVKHSSLPCKMTPSNTSLFFLLRFPAHPQGTHHFSVWGCFFFGTQSVQRS